LNYSDEKNKSKKITEVGTHHNSSCDTDFLVYFNLFSAKYIQLLDAVLVDGAYIVRDCANG